MDRIALYIRLSEADDDVKNGLKDESNSITAQKQLLHKFVENHEELSKCEAVEYFDDGLTGTGFLLRDSFQQMLEDARNGLISCIVVKDLSRLGRDYLEVGNYMEFVFPSIGVRLISVNDHYDSDRNYGMTGGMDVAFKNLIYQLYSRDLSRKIKSARKNRNRNGEFTGPLVAYGYVRDPKHHNKLVINENEAGVVRQIFQLYGKGKTINEITHILNASKIRTRMMKQVQDNHMKLKRHAEDELWCPTSVGDILAKELYTGLLVQNKTKVVGFGDDKKIVDCPEEEWTVVENGVPAIISKEEFDKVQVMLQKNRLKGVAEKKPKSKPMIYVCGYCGRRLSRKWSKRYDCRMREASVNGKCRCVSVKQGVADRYVLDTVKEMCSLMLEKEKLLSLSVNEDKDDAVSLPDLKSERDQLESSVIGLYKEFQTGKLSKESYLAKRKEISDLVADIDERIAGLSSASAEDKRQEKADYEALLDSLTDEFDPFKMSEIIEKVLVYGADRMEIVFKNEDVFRI